MTALMLRRADQRSTQGPQRHLDGSSASLRFIGAISFVDSSARSSAREHLVEIACGRLVGRPDVSSQATGLLSSR